MPILANVYLRTWNRRSPSVPTAIQEQRDAGVADATYWRDKAKHMAALMAMAGATLCEPVSTANIRDAKKSCDLGVHVMREIMQDEKRVVSSSEEAANSDTPPKNASRGAKLLAEMLHSAGRETPGDRVFINVIAKKSDWYLMLDAVPYFGNASAKSAARVQGENSQ